VNRNNLRAALKLLAPMAAQAAKTRIQEADAVATGRLRDSVKGNVDESKDSIRLFLTAEDYYEAVDKGQRPGKLPSKQKIAEWARAKGITPYNGLSNQWAEGFMVWRIRKAIEQRGTIKRFGYKGIGINQYVTQALGNKILNDAKRAYKKDIEEAINNGRSKN
jgi:hypothetical protein